MGDQTSSQHRYAVVNATRSPAASTSIIQSRHRLAVHYSQNIHFLVKLTVSVERPEKYRYTWQPRMTQQDSLVWGRRSRVVQYCFPLLELQFFHNLQQHLLVPHPAWSGYLQRQVCLLPSRYNVRGSFDDTLNQRSLVLGLFQIIVQLIQLVVESS